MREKLEEGGSRRRSWRHRGSASPRLFPIFIFPFPPHHRHPPLLSVRLTNHPILLLFPDYLYIYSITNTISRCLLRWMPRAASSCRRSLPWRGPATIAASLATRVGPFAITSQAVAPADQQSLPGIINTLCPLLPSTLAPRRSSCHRRPTRRSHHPATYPTPTRLPCLS